MSTSTVCLIDGRPILTMAFRGTGACSGICLKALAAKQRFSNGQPFFTNGSIVTRGWTLPSATFEALGLWRAEDQP